MGRRDDNKRTFLQLAHTFNLETGDPVGYYMSEKLDGMRCFWDGGITKGMKAGDVPWANTAKIGADHISTGLWSRGGKVVHCPEGWTKGFPKHFLDGELWSPDLVLQDIVSITRAHEKESEWEAINYWVFDIPGDNFLRAGRIHDGTWETVFPDMSSWAMKHGYVSDPTQRFANVVDTLFKLEVNVSLRSALKRTNIRVLDQTLVESKEQMLKALDQVVKKGGEGLILKAADVIWTPRRVHECVKVKKFYDAEAMVVGITFGEETDKDSRLRGMIGALIVQELNTGHVFQLAGLNDSERGIDSFKLTAQMRDKARRVAYDNPGASVLWNDFVPVPKTVTKVLSDSDWIGSETFEPQQVITFKYWDRTKDGVPKYAQYWRDKTDE